MPKPALFSKPATANPPPPIALPEALSTVAADREAAQKALTHATVRRGDLVRAGAPDSEVESAEVEIRRAQRALERANALDTELTLEAESQRRAQTEADFVAFYAKYRFADRAFRDGLHEAYRRRSALIALIDEGQRQFPGRVGAYVAVPIEELTLDDWMITCHERDAEAALANESRRAKGEW